MARNLQLVEWAGGRGMSTPSLLARRRLGSDVVSEPRAAGATAGTPSLHRSRRPPQACLLLSRFRPQHRRPLYVDDGDAALGPRFCLPSAVMSAASQREHWTKGPTVKLPPTALPCGPRLCYSLPACSRWGALHQNSVSLGLVQRAGRARACLLLAADWSSITRGRDFAVAA